MPTYDFVCKKCGRQWEEFVSMSERENEKCSKCGQLAETLISTPNLDIFKPFFEPNLSWNGDMITSRKQLRDLCRKKKVQHSALL